MLETTASDAIPERDAFARLRDLVATLPDEVQRVAALAAVADAQDATRRAEEELQEMLHVASHDLTEPLRMVTSYLKLLERRAGPALDERAREFVFYAVDGADRMKAQLDDLLHYSRVGHGVAAPTVVYLDTLVVEVLRDLGPAIADAGAIVEVDGHLPAVVGDRQQLGQLLQNLVGNAVKFRRPERGNTVRLAATRMADTEAWELTVSDDGIGIDTAQAARIWRVFQRLHSREQYAGNGIGLALCRRIAERHGGRIWVTPADGGGSVFHVCLHDDPVAAGVLSVQERR
ncbi:ATP-binding protein [Paraconexibacter sp. AEG42_29]|uniref:sensor histidine kinase n=1 Tax=Paraconexibacter sp. AEG42_29 TaxID=2997339 RepID=UPI00339D5C3C